MALRHVLCVLTISAMILNLRYYSYGTQASDHLICILGKQQPSWIWPQPYVEDNVGSLMKWQQQL